MFFRKPNETEEPMFYGTLYLLRRDILTCLGTDPDTGQVLEHKARWPALMAILAGIDLLGKFVEGRGVEQGSSNLKFKGYLEGYLAVDSEEDRETLYQLRCAVLHSFGWFSICSRTKREYRFQLAGVNDVPLIQRTADGQGRDVYIVALGVLYESSRSRYRTTWTVSWRTMRCRQNSRMCF